MTEPKAEREKLETFLKDAARIAHEVSPGVTIVITPLVSRYEPGSEPYGISIRWPDGGICEITAQTHAYSIKRSDGMYFQQPWYAFDDPLRHVRKALQGFFQRKKRI